MPLGMLSKWISSRVPPLRKYRMDRTFNNLSGSNVANSNRPPSSPNYGFKGNIAKPYGPSVHRSIGVRERRCGRNSL